MTRFARAKGSKASNIREPEEATSWQEIKQQLLEKQQTVENDKKRAEMDEKRTKNYKAFLEESENNNKKTEWAEFPGVTKKLSEKVKKDKKIKKVLKDNLEEISNDEEVAEQFDLLREKIETVLSAEQESNKTESSQLKKKKRSKKSKISQPVADKMVESEETPEKTSSTVESPQIAIKKKKPKQKKVNISPEQSQVAEKPKDKVVNGKKKAKKVKQKKPVEEMTKEELEKVEKNKQKKLAQLERKRIFKAMEAERQKNAPKPPKVRDNKIHPRRKEQRPNSITISGKEISISYFEGFPVKKEDYDRLKQLQKDMKSKGLPLSEINRTLKLERRKAEKNLAREKKKRCFKCRQSGHNLSECPALNEGEVETSGTGVCFKCGSTEHTHFQCKVVHKDQFNFAQCFICKEQGHIARQCPDNNRGMYPKGGACRVCGDVTHLKKDCPKFQMQQEQSTLVAQTIDSGSLETLDTDKKRSNGNVKERKNKIIKF